MEPKKMQRGEEGRGKEDTETPQLPFTTSSSSHKPHSKVPTTGDAHSLHNIVTASASGSASALDHSSRVQKRRLTKSGRPKELKHIRLQAAFTEAKSPASSIYRGSYGQSPRSRSSLRTPGSSAHSTPRLSMSQSQLEKLLQDLDIELETYGVEEFRDGFFDGSFLKPQNADHEDLMRDAEYTLPAAFKKKNSLSSRNFFPKQWHGIKKVVREVTTTRAGIKLTRSFLAFFIAYILCLIPVIRVWLGRYSYIMVLSALINHPGRTVGAQIDGAILTIAGTATGLGWGAFALWVSDSTSIARRGYGGILAAFLVLFMGIISALRSYFIRLYQLVLCAGIAVAYTVLAETSESVNWGKLFDYGIPWVFGQGICLLICSTIFPDAGARPLAESLHGAFRVMQDGLILPQPDPLDIHRQLSLTFVNLSQAYRDLVLDISITRFLPRDVMLLRNLMQGVVRSFLALKLETKLFEEVENKQARIPAASRRKRGSQTVNKELQEPGPILNTVDGEDIPMKPSLDGTDAIINIDTQLNRPHIFRTNTEERAINLVIHKLADPTRKLLRAMRSSLERCDAVLMEMSGYRTYLGPSKDISTDVIGALTKMRKSMIKYDNEEESLMTSPDLPPTYSNHPGIIELFLFVHPIRQAATSTEKLVVKVMEMQQKHRGWKFYLPSYPFSKALQRTNAQVRHDRGGLTAGFYFRSQTQLARTMKGMANVYEPPPRAETDGAVDNNDEPKHKVRRTDTIGKYEEEEDVAMNRDSKATKTQRFRYRLWVILHRLQGFETRFALKVALITSLLAIPAWLNQSRDWWNENESWWVVVMVWVMSHPRVGGNIQDLVTRAFCGVLGAVWGGIAFGAGNGDPYIMAVFAAIYMIPMLYRFTQSPHPRSGIVGCIAFIVVSLSAKANNDQSSIVRIAWTRGVAFVVGVVAAVGVNWVLWPFVARHELRKALSSMLIYESIIYRGVVAKYVYYEKGQEPRKEDVERSEMLEGRLREGFVRIRQLMALTRHEIRLRAEFNPLPYSALIDSCEQFFEYLVSVRQSSLFFHPHFMSDDDQAAESLLAFRRDAVAAILMCLYVLAGALRGNRPIPKYLPSAAAARKRLLDHMASLEGQAEQAQAELVREGEEVKRVETEGDGEKKKWSQVYSYSYSQSLTGCVEQLGRLIKFTKEVVGEVGFDPVEMEDVGSEEEEEEEEDDDDDEEEISETRGRKGRGRG